MSDALVISRQNSVQALQARSAFISSYWAWRSYQASRLPSLYLYGEAASFDRSLRLLQDPETGKYIYTENYNMQNSLGLSARQNITFTGGTLSLYSDLTRIDEFNFDNTKTWYAQPVTLSYSQPLFTYNRFKWEKLISPKEYESAKRKYLESMEAVNISTVEYFYELMLAQEIYDASRENYRNTMSMLSIAGERMKLGTVTRDEYLQLELRALNDSISINENLVSLREAQMHLNSILGYDETHSIEPVLEENLPDIFIDYTTVRQKASNNSSFYLENEISVLNADADIAQAKAQRGITMELDARFGLSHSGSEFRQTYKNLLDQEVVGLTFSVPIFDWGEAKGRIRKAQAAADVVKAQVQQAENDYNISLFTAVGQFNNQRNQCNVSRRAKMISSERYSLVMDKFRNGTATVTDLNTARTESDSALQKYIQDVSNYWTYYYTLRQLTLYDFIAGCDVEVSYDEMID